MSDWKNTEWQEKLKNKPFRYWIRDEIEEIVKEENIDRKRFGECSKLKYEDVIKRFYYTYMDYEKYPKIELSYCWLHFRDSIKKTNNIYVNGGWEHFLHQIRVLIEEKEDAKLYMILSQGWVYEGYIKEILDVLGETDGLLEDFYLVSRDFDWMIAYCDDGESAALYSV
ncbi:MAG: hypothetical protein IKJ39_07840 [Lachnospiraceae bacterium]|nr:hypothetical protein [Lachnospiraceae bacterium]